MRAPLLNDIFCFAAESRAEAKVKSAKMSLSSCMTRFPSVSEVAEVLADTLCTFSLDLIKIIRGYLVFSAASADGKLTASFLWTIGSKGEMDGQFSYVCEAVGCGSDNVWVISSKRLSLFNSEGKFLRHIAQGRWQNPVSLSVAANGDAYIVDTRLSSVTVCRSDGTVLRTIGGTGRFSYPCAAAVDKQNARLFVCDEPKRLQMLNLSLDGCDSESAATMDISVVGGMAVNTTNEIAVSDTQRRQVKVRTVLFCFALRSCVLLIVMAHCFVCAVDQCTGVRLQWQACA